MTIDPTKPVLYITANDKTGVVSAFKLEVPEETDKDGKVTTAARTVECRYSEKDGAYLSIEKTATRLEKKILKKADALRNLAVYATQADQIKLNNFELDTGASAKKGVVDLRAQLAALQNETASRMVFGMEDTTLDEETKNVIVLKSVGSVLGYSRVKQNPSFIQINGSDFVIHYDAAKDEKGGTVLREIKPRTAKLLKEKDGTHAFQELHGPRKIENTATNLTEQTALPKQLNKQLSKAFPEIVDAFTAALATNPALELTVDGKPVTTNKELALKRKLLDTALGLGVEQTNFLLDKVLTSDADKKECIMRAFKHANNKTLIPALLAREDMNTSEMKDLFLKGAVVVNNKELLLAILADKDFADVAANLQASVALAPLLITKKDKDGKESEAVSPLVKYLLAKGGAAAVAQTAEWMKMINEAEAKTKGKGDGSEITLEEKINLIVELRKEIRDKITGGLDANEVQSITVGLQKGIDKARTPSGG